MNNQIILVLSQHDDKLVESLKLFISEQNIDFVVCIRKGSDSASIASPEMRSWDTRYGMGTYGQSSDNSTHAQRVNFQRDLNCVMGSNLSLDGYIGPSTRAVIYQFQQQQKQNGYNISVDGQAGGVTKQRLHTVAQAQGCF